MLEAHSTESYAHRLDGLPEERRLKRVASRNLTLRNPVLGRVVDLSSHGLGLECNHPLRLFDQYLFTIVGETCRIRKKGEVRWSRLTVAGVDARGEPEMVYRVGVALLDR